MPPPPVAAHYGVPYAPIAPMLRVYRNVQALGMAWCIYAALHIVTGFIGLLFIQHFAVGSWPFRHRSFFGYNEWGHAFGLGGPLLPLIGVAVIALAALGAAAGWGLLNRQPWARNIAIVAAVLALFKFPLGTALGIYTLWVLLPGESRAEWESITGRP